jgi:hypothetical protein
MKAYKVRKLETTLLAVNTSYEGETIEGKVRRIMNNKEPISDSAPIIYTDRKEGVMPDYDIRTDRFEIAVDAMDRVTKDKIAKREANAATKTEDKKDTGGEPLQGTGEAPKTT